MLLVLGAVGRGAIEQARPEVAACIAPSELSATLHIKHTVIDDLGNSTFLRVHNILSIIDQAMPANDRVYFCTRECRVAQIVFTEFIYKALHHKEICKVFLLLSALYAKCLIYYVVLRMQNGRGERTNACVIVLELRTVGGPALQHACVPVHPRRELELLREQYLPRQYATLRMQLQLPCFSLFLTQYSRSW